MSEQIRERSFWTNVVLFQPVKVILALHCGCHGHKAVEAACVESAVFILRAAIHSFPVLERFSDSTQNLHTQNVTHITKLCEIVTLDVLPEEIRRAYIVVFCVGWRRNCQHALSPSCEKSETEQATAIDPR